MNLNNSLSDRTPHCLFVLGPTACGKSDLAVEIAEDLSQNIGRSIGKDNNKDTSKSIGKKIAKESALSAEIINCDSIQFFAGVEIGAAKPGPELLRRAPHHLIGHVPVGGVYNAGDFRRDALRVIEERSREGIELFLPVGGSGFYVQALEKGMYDVPDIAPHVREELEQELASQGATALHDELRARDPEAASKIQPADRYRIVRALEILRSHPAGGTLSEIRARFEAEREPPPFRVSKIGVFVPRDVLRKRVIERTRRMLKAGFLDEVRSLREQGYASWAPLLSVGYKEVQESLDGRLGEAELEEAIVTSTMQLAKRQMTWFKRDADIRWFDSEKDWKAALEFARARVET